MGRLDNRQVSMGGRLVLPVVLGLCLSGQAVADSIPTADAASGLKLEKIISDRTLRRGGRKLVRWLTGEKESRLLVRPYAASWDGNALVVADPGASRILRIASGGKFSRSRAGAFESPVGVAVCADGIVVADSKSGAVSLLDRELRRLRVLADGLARPTGVACTDDRVFVAETGRHRVVILDPGQQRQVEPEAWGDRGEAEGEFNFPTLVTWDRDSLWVGDTLNFRIQQLHGRSGRFLQAFGRLGDSPGEMARTKGIGIDSNGRIWVTDAHLDQVALFAADGTFLAHFGGTGREPGQFSFPSGLAVHEDGRIAVVDSLNRRIQVFRLLPDRKEKRR